MTILICWRLPQVEIMPLEYLDLLNPNTRCYGKTFLVGSASLDPTLVIPMRVRQARGKMYGFAHLDILTIYLKLDSHNHISK